MDTASRRDFLLVSGLLGASKAWGLGQPPQEQEHPGPQPVGEAVPAAEGADITTATLAEAEKLAAVELTEVKRAQALDRLDEQIERFRARRALSLPNDVAPATRFDPRPAGWRIGDQPRPIVRLRSEPAGLAADERDVAYAPLSALARWIERGELSSQRLTEIYLERLRRIGPKLECVVTLVAERALRQARRADREISAGRYRGPLHGIPWGAKDLFDTAGVGTTWGATPYRDRVPKQDSAVVRMLEAAGAVLVAKTTLGALAYGDIWFGGRTNNPWNLEQGSSGSSAGSAAATAAGLVGFSLGTETLGSIVSPCMRCGTTGLRPTFGRVPRTGAMALCWSLDKIGPICRTAEDCGLVLSAINGHDPADPSSLDVPFGFDATRPARGLRVGYDPAWFEGATEIDRRVLEVARQVGLTLVEVSLPQWPYGSLMSILLVEAAAAFEELTLSNRDDQLVWQKPQAWPNTFRQTRFIPAIEYVQAQRFRRQVMAMMADTFRTVDAMISPSYAGSLLLITNNTGHPSLTIRAGFKEDGTPHGITLWGRLFEVGKLCRIGMALEESLGVRDMRPPL